MNPITDSARRRPLSALAVATALGLGYLPKAPGTFGSLGGVFLTWLTWTILSRGSDQGSPIESFPFLILIGASIIVVSALGVWAAGRVAVHFQKKDPQIVVVDEVSGQMISYLGLAIAPTFDPNWHYLLAGFILFRVFDIWKPFPVRRAESLPGGLGIMADDWMAGAYAALVLALARRFGF
jgi:phosphatidylglycerophosphatase A